MAFWLTKTSPGNIILITVSLKISKTVGSACEIESFCTPANSSVYQSQIYLSLICPYITYGLEAPSSKDTSQQNSIAIKKSSSKLRHGSKLIQWKSEGLVYLSKLLWQQRETSSDKHIITFYQFGYQKNMQMRSHDSSQLKKLLIKMGTLFPVILIFLLVA